MKPHLLISAFLLVLTTGSFSMEKEQPCETPSTVSAKVTVEDAKETIEEKEIIDMARLSFILVDPTTTDEEKLKEIEEKGVPVYNILLPTTCTVENLLEIIEKVATVKIEQLSFFEKIYSTDLLVSQLPSGEYAVLSAFIKK